MKKQNQSSNLFLLLYKQTSIELWRNKIGVLLLFLIPALFLGVAVWTAGEGTLPIRLYFYKKTQVLLLTQKNISLVFMAAAVNGFLSAFYANILFHQDFHYFKYCASMGMPPYYFAASRFSFFITLIVLLALFITIIIQIVLPINQLMMMLFGFILLGVIYGAYGGIVGVLCKDYLVALLLIVLLVNFDAGWLQNPVFYSYAQETELIHWLPAFYPCQLLFSSIFTEAANGWSCILSGSYALIFISVLLFIVFQQMKSVYKCIQR